MKTNFNILENELELIENYLNQNLTKDELNKFENRMRSDAEFSRKVEDVRSMLDGIETAVFRDKLESFHTSLNDNEVVNTNSTNKRQSSFPFAKYMIAASVMVIGVFWFLTNSNGSDQLFEDHFHPDPGLPTTMGTNANFKFLEGMVDYKLGDYKMAIDKWQLLLKENPESDTLNYFLGIAHLAELDDQKAIEFLNKTLQSQESSFASEAYYYKALALIKSGDIEKAKEVLLKSDHEKSNDVLNELNN